MMLRRYCGICVPEATGKSATTAFSYYRDSVRFSRFMKRRRGLVPADTEIKILDPGLIQPQKV